MKFVIEAKNLVKRFGDLIAVNGISFQVQKGQCFGFLGPNGAGKTTTMKMIYGFSPLSEGELTIFGLPAGMNEREIKRRIGVAPQEMSLDPDLTVIQNLKIFARYFDLSKEKTEKKCEDLLNFFHLKEKSEQPIDHLSGGMKRRLLVARALMNEPEVLILDEPTTGLDPQSRRVMWERMQELKERGVTLLLTTHYMDEAESLCDQIVVIDYGKIIAEGKPQELIQKQGVKNLEELFLKLTGKGLRD